MKAERARRAGDTVLDGPLRVVGCRRGRQIDRFLEERAVERIRLVEDRQHLQRSVVQQPFQGVLAPGDEPFDECDRMCVIPFRAHLGLLHQRPQALERGGQPRGIVGAHHAPAAGQGHRFHDAGIRQGLRAHG